MRFPLRRFYQDERQTLGTLTAGSVTLFTIERPWLQNQPHVSCIPPGDYKITIIQIGAEEKIRLEGGCIPSERTLINIEVANRAEQLEGCIGVGCGVRLEDAVNGIYMATDSRRAHNRLFQEIAEDVVCTLQISDPWNT